MDHGLISNVSCSIAVLLLFLNAHLSKDTENRSE